MFASLKNISQKVGLLVGVSIGLCAITAHAQQAKVHTLLKGGTTWLPAASTNVVVVGSSTNTYGNPGTATNLVLAVSEFDYVGFTFGLTGTATSTNSVLIFKSYDDAVTFESVPSYSYLTIAPGAASWSTNALLDVRGATHIAFVIRSAGTTPGTNALLSVNLKSPKYGARAATQ